MDSLSAAALGPQILITLQIIWIDIILSGDNAVVIALACRGLPPEQRRWGIILGAGAAVLLRVVFAIVVVELLSTPFLKLVGGALLLFIAVKLVTDETGEDEGKIKVRSTLWGAIWTVAAADAVMSLDNVLAIAAAARGQIPMLIFGLMLSIPLIVTGASLIVRLLDKLPALIWAGGALLGWVAGEMLASDPALIDWMKSNAAGWLVTAPVEHHPSGLMPVPPLYYGIATAGALLVLATGSLIRRRRAAA